MSVPSIGEQVNIRGVPVNFPFVPYKCQIDYMECVITSLQEVRQFIFINCEFLRLDGH